MDPGTAYGGAPGDQHLSLSQQCKVGVMPHKRKLRGGTTPQTPGSTRLQVCSPQTWGLSTAPHCLPPGYFHEPLALWKLFYLGQVVSKALGSTMKSREVWLLVEPRDLGCYRSQPKGLHILISPLCLPCSNVGTAQEFTSSHGNTPP